jgi:hypothetical protein
VRHLRIESDAELEALTQALEDLSIKPFRGQAMQDARVLLERLAAPPDVPSMQEAMRHAREAMGLCEARVRDLSGTTRDGTRGCGATLTPDGVCPAATLHV